MGDLSNFPSFACLFNNEDYIDMSTELSKINLIGGTKISANTFVIDYYGKYIYWSNVTTLGIVKSITTFESGCLANLTGLTPMRY